MAGECLINMPGVLDCFDCAYVVNRDSDVDRFERVNLRLRNLEIPFKRFSAHPPFRSELLFDACVYSHIAILKEVLQSNCESVLILEDDVVFRDDTREWMLCLSSEIRLQNWEILHLGLHLHEAMERVSEHLGRVKRGNQTHAYAVRREAIPRILDCINRTLSASTGTFDGFLYNQLLRLYTIPILAIQEPTYSYTYDRVVDRLAQYFTLFDGDDFERHCAEMKSWKSNWRATREFMLALKMHRQGRIADALDGYRRGLYLCSPLRAAVECDPICAAIMSNGYECDHPTDMQGAANTLLEAILRYWQPEIEKLPVTKLDDLKRAQATSRM
jgi:hypothetical protein